MNKKLSANKFVSLLLPISCLLSGLTISTSQAHAANAPLLRCEVTYAGTTQQIDTQLSNDPYTAQIHDIGGRFSFKAVMIGEPNKPIHYIKLYAYLQGHDFDIPIHQATYQATRQAPIRVAKTMRALTPFNHLYAGEVEREMQYQCYLGWDKK